MTPPRPKAKTRKHRKPHAGTWLGDSYRLRVRSQGGRAWLEADDIMQFRHVELRDRHALRSLARHILAALGDDA